MPKNNDILNESIHDFIKWRDEKEYRKACTTRVHKFNWRGGGTTGVWSKNRKEYYCHDWPFRVVEDAHKVEYSNIDHRGWYEDSKQDGLIVGKVLRLTSIKGEGRYIAATYGTNYESVTLYLNCIFDEASEAAKYADKMAELEAEVARETDAQYQAEQEIADNESEISDTRIACLQAIKEYKKLIKLSIACEQFPALKQIVFDTINNSKHTIEKLRKRIKNLQNNYWLAVEN